MGIESQEFQGIIDDIHKSDNPEEKFLGLANYLMNHVCISVGKHKYRIIELEIYYNDNDKHKDPYVYCANEQLSSGTWYFHYYGLDITFGSDERKIYGGILIRGIMSLGDKETRYISGPLIVVNELFSGIGDIFSFRTEFCLSELDQSKIENKEIIPELTQIRASTRSGLTKKEDVDNYINREYRYSASS